MKHGITHRTRAVALATIMIAGFAVIAAVMVRGTKDELMPAHPGIAVGAH